MRWVTTTLMLESLRKSQDQAWDDLVERFRAPIVRFACAAGLAEDLAEDVAQEALMDFVKAYRSGQYDRDKGRLRSWLFGIANNRVLRARDTHRGRKLKSTVKRTAFWNAVPDEASARKSWDVCWDRAIFDQCLAQIRAEVESRTVRAFEEFAIHKRPAAEVAADLEISRNAVFLAKHRVLKRLVELQEQFEGAA